MIHAGGGLGAGASALFPVLLPRSVALLTKNIIKTSGTPPLVFATLVVVSGVEPPTFGV